MVDRGGPRDLAAVRDGILAASGLAALLDTLPQIPSEIADASSALLRPDSALAAELRLALADELPALKRDGGFVRAGYDSALDEARGLRDESRKVVAQLQARYADDSAVRGLKIRHNNVLGYFVEVTAQHGEKLLSAPLNATFIHRQTLAGQVRFTTTELGELEAKIANAADRALGLELEIFERLSASVTAASAAIKSAAEALAALDVSSSLAALAIERTYVRPLVNRSLEFVVEGGRHAVVEQALASASFVANDCELSPPKDTDAGRIWLLTGPNMAGKSTLLRQNALIVVLAQMGGFVPPSARRSAVDRCSRASAPLMILPAAVDLHGRDGGDRRDPQPGRRTLAVIGMKLAAARRPSTDFPSPGPPSNICTSNCCRALFATHFHELRRCGVSSACTTQRASRNGRETGSSCTK